MIKLFTLKQEKKDQAEKKDEKKSKITSAEIRIQKDMDELSLPNTCKMEFPDPDDLLNFKLILKPDEGFYRGGTFHFSFKIKSSYPHDPPKVQCLQKIYHPNIDLEGNVCLNILREDWKPVLSINAVVIGLQYLFLDPNADDPLNKEAAKVLRANRNEFESNVKKSMRGGSIDSEKNAMYQVQHGLQVSPLHWEMFLYDLVLQPCGSISTSAAGNFSGEKQQEIIVLRGSSLLELLKHDPTTGKLSTALSQDLFGVVRSISPFRLIGSSKDYLIVGSDSGRIVILEYDPVKNVFNKVHQETFGKTGCRRIIPGQYVAVDPKGRACMIAAIEKQKFVYVLNRDVEARLTISSPLEAHKGKTIVFACVGVDMGFENPIFACLEVDYTEADEEEMGFESTEKVVTYYELDLGLNHVVRRWSEVVSPRSSYLIGVPGGNDGPGGVIVCSEDSISWCHQGHKQLRVPMPRRNNPFDDGERGNLIVASAVHRTRTIFFILVQTEQGDLFKITLDYEKENVNHICISYFDTVPTGTSLCLLRTGFLFVATEFGSHQLYQIQSLGDDEDRRVTSIEPEIMYFEPREPKNLVLIPEAEIDTLNPIIDCKVLNLNNEESPQFYTICGQGRNSSLKVLRHGLEVSEVGVSDLPGVPTAVWTLKAKNEDLYDSFIIVSFANETLILSIGETVSEVEDSGFFTGTKTLAVGILGDDSFVQVYPTGIRHITVDKKTNEWKAPYHREILHATMNEKQVAVALNGGEIVYFELDSGNLNEFEERKLMPAEITSISIANVSNDRQRFPFLAVGCSDSMVRLLSLNPDDCLGSVSMQALSCKASSLLMTEETIVDIGTIYLNVGLENGVLIRLIVDSVTAALSDARSRFLGPKSIKLFPVDSGKAVLALSSRPWLQYLYQNRSSLAPLFLDSIEFASGFSSEQCPNGIVAVAGNTLRIFVLDKLGNVFNQQAIPLKYTPRKFIFHPEFKSFIIIESDHNMHSEKSKEELLQGEMCPEWLDGPCIAFRPGFWASCLRIINPTSETTTFLLDFEDNESTVSISTCFFHGRPGESFLAVGTAKDLTMSPRTCTSGYIYIFKFSSDGYDLTLIHKTPIEDVPTAMCSFQGRLLVGMGQSLRIYDFGKKKLLRKCESKSFPHCITSIHSQGSRVIVGDIQESVHFALYRADLNQFFVFCDDSLPRYLTCITPLDYDTLAGADKFGNVFVLRIPKHVARDLDEDPSGNKLMSDKPCLMGAPHKLDHVVQYHVGDIVTSLSKTNLVFGGQEVLVYTTLQGSIGMLSPFVTKDSLEFFQLLEIALRNEFLSLVGRDHLSYRSYYGPVRSVVDGNLIEQYLNLPLEKKQEIAQIMERTPAEITKRIQEMRTNVAY